MDNKIAIEYSYIDNCAIQVYNKTGVLFYE